MPTIAQVESVFKNRKTVLIIYDYIGNDVETSLIELSSALKSITLKGNIPLYPHWNYTLNAIDKNDVELKKICTNTVRTLINDKRVDSAIVFTRTAGNEISHSMRKEIAYCSENGITVEFECI